MFSKNSKEQTKNSSIVGESVLIEGNFDCLEDVVIYGKINGSIKTTEDVYIKESSIINADIKSKNLFLEGEVNGNIDCLEYVEISSSAKVNGDISTKIINIEKGAMFNGKCTIKEDKKTEDIDVVVSETKDESLLKLDDDVSVKVKNKKLKTK